MKQLMTKIGMALLVLGILITTFTGVETMAGDDIKKAGTNAAFITRNNAISWVTLTGSMMIISGTVIALCTRRTRNLFED